MCVWKQTGKYPYLRVFFPGIFETRLKYCSLAKMFYVRSASRRINHLQGRAYWLIDVDYELSIE